MSRRSILSSERPALRPFLRRLALMFTLGLLALATLRLPAAAQKMPSLGPPFGRSIGDRPYDFTLKDLGGQAHSLGNLKGKKVVHLVFWATWCVPCMQEAPVIGRAYAKYRDRGLEVLAVVVNMDQTPNGVRAVARDYKIDYPILWDDGGTLMNRYRIALIPQNFLIGKDGIIRYAGSSLPADYDALVQKLLGEGGAAN